MMFKFLLCFRPAFIASPNILDYVIDLPCTVTYTSLNRLIYKFVSKISATDIGCRNYKVRVRHLMSLRI